MRDRGGTLIELFCDVGGGGDSFPSSVEIR